MLLRLSLVLLLLVAASSCGTRILTTKHVTSVSSPTPPIERPSTVPSDWKRVEVADKFTFYMPADMKTDPEIDMFDGYGPGAFYVNPQLRWNYQYATEDLCLVTTSDLLLKDPTHHESEVDIGGKSAKAHTWTSRTGDHFIIGCLPDIDGGGTYLHVGARGKDERVLDVARQIFASIQFRKGAT